MTIAVYHQKNLISLIESFRICDYYISIICGVHGYLSEAGCLPRFSKARAIEYSVALA
jgi:hypothetical protein